MPLPEMPAVFSSEDLQKMWDNPQLLTGRFTPANQPVLDDFGNILQECTGRSKEDFQKQLEEITQNYPLREEGKRFLSK